MGKFDDTLDVEVGVKDTTDGKRKVITFYGIQKGDLNGIVSRLVDNTGFKAVPKPDKNVEMVFTKMGNLIVTVYKDKIQDFLKTGMKSIISGLVASRNYDFDKIKHLEDVTGFMLEKPGKEDIKRLHGERKTTMAELWTEYLNKVSDPETMEQLKLYAQIFGNTIYGHALSLKNVMAIKGMAKKYGTNPTFVLGRTKWKEYGRDVRGGAKPYPLWTVVDKGRASKADLEAARLAAQAELGQSDVNYEDLGVTVQDKINIEASKILDKNQKEFVPYIGYDIADTYLINPKEDDLLKTKPNISGNIVYQLNALAQEAEAKKNDGKREGIDAEKDNAMKGRSEKALEAMNEICVADNISYEQGGSAEGSLVNALLAYYRKYASAKLNVLKPENVEQHAKDATQLTLMMTDTALNQLSRFTHPLEYTEKEATTLGNLIVPIVSEIGRALIKEGNEDLMGLFWKTLDRAGIKVVRDEDIPMQEAMKKPQSLQEATRNFYLMLNKLNKPY